ncbi:hypothetical protein NUW54_g3927 [Trametes sanguinea]|uniref:Uncharacterized protein n=1 Tax=Trametes sanguinea TaxID=158606 RepID=A0ACC1PZD0_9APHY|nr:hypothetical protein NUW54_g3927 [Trametes sanguinea]
MSAHGAATSSDTPERMHYTCTTVGWPRADNVKFTSTPPPLRLSSSTTSPPPAACALSIWAGVPELSFSSSTAEPEHLPVRVVGTFATVYDDLRKRRSEEASPDCLTDPDSQLSAVLPRSPVSIHAFLYMRSNAHVVVEAGAGKDLLDALLELTVRGRKRHVKLIPLAASSPASEQLNNTSVRYEYVLARPLRCRRRRSIQSTPTDVPPSGRPRGWTGARRGERAALKVCAKLVPGELRLPSLRRRCELLPSPTSRYARSRL